MKSVLPVKMLAAMALVLLVFSVTEGRILSKCELKAQLEAAQIQVIRAMGNRMTVDDLIARLVCKANATGFNTSFVKAIAARPKESHLFGHHKQRPVWKLYGVFQLSDQLACDSGTMSSLNVCNMSCSALIDDDVTDDIACLKTVIGSIKPKPKNASDITLPLATTQAVVAPPPVPGAAAHLHLRGQTQKRKPKPKNAPDITLPLATLNTILVKECLFVVPSRYFAECVNATTPIAVGLYQ